ncbi:protein DETOXIFICATION 29-like isoform X3 [Papaver somniferum]|uniref:protein DETOXIFICATION 29-like isoform X3 n=1 Tax=Papaver somniferum TaxID=3469 RepID=UPI000E6F4E1A|nr:protein DETOXIFICATION 29-like isoform X3 [Papaver somniferum]
MRTSIWSRKTNTARDLHAKIMGRCKDAWSGFSWKALTELLDFLWLSVASSVMLCLEYWAFMILIVFAGVLKNAEVKVDAAAICMNVEGWIFMVPLGYIAAVSVRVSNELGAGNAADAKFSVWVTVSVSLVTQTAFAALILVTRYDFPRLFTDDEIVMKEVSNLAVYLCTSIILCGVQPVLTGMAIGAGWQTIVAYVNITTYYLIGLPIGVFMAFKLNWGLEGLWVGTQIGMCLQTIVLIIMCWRADWDKEVQLSKDRVSEDVSTGEEQKLIH